jgi:hypothetical protein
MPQKLDEMVKALKRDGYPEDQAWAIAQSKFRQMKDKASKRGPQDRKK